MKTVIKEDSLHGDKTCAQGSDLEDSAFGLIFCCCRLEILNTFLNKGALSFWTAPFKLFNQSRQQTEQLLKSLPRQVGFSGLGLAPLLGELCFDRKKKKKNLSIKIDHRQKCHAMFALSHLFYCLFLGDHLRGAFIFLPPATNTVYSPPSPRAKSETSNLHHFVLCTQEFVSSQGTSTSGLPLTYSVFPL